jgi:hypothetical protein
LWSPPSPPLLHGSLLQQVRADYPEYKGWTDVSLKLALEEKFPEGSPQYEAIVKRDPSRGVEIDFGRLFVQWFLIACVGVVLAFTTRPTRRQR